MVRHYEEPDRNADWCQAHDRAYRTTLGILGCLKADDHSRMLITEAWRTAFEATHAQIRMAASAVATLTQDVFDLRDRLANMQALEWTGGDDADAWLPDDDPDLVESIDCDGNPILVDVRAMGAVDAWVG